MEFTHCEVWNCCCFGWMPLDVTASFLAHKLPWKGHDWGILGSLLLISSLGKTSQLKCSSLSTTHHTQVHNHHPTVYCACYCEIKELSFYSKIGSYFNNRTCAHKSHTHILFFQNCMFVYHNCMYSILEALWL